MPHLVDCSAFFRAGDDQIRRWRQEQGLAGGAFVFGRVGQPFPAKWAPVAIDAFATVAARRPEAHLVLIGLPETLRPRIARLPAKVRSRILTPPFEHGDARLRVCYSAIDCFLHASTCGESFGYVLVESMLCGTPVITLGTPLRDNSQLEVVGHERGGLVVNDRGTMIAAMERLMDDPALRQRLATQGRRSVLDEYAIDRLGPRLSRLLELTLAHGGRADLRPALEREGFLTHVESQEIRELLHNSLGRVPLSARALMHATHLPGVHASIVRLKDLRRRLVK
jgi:glycosyltransferase involved in cell wall biosynthesis